MHDRLGKVRKRIVVEALRRGAGAMGLWDYGTMGLWDDKGGVLGCDRALRRHLRQELALPLALAFCVGVLRWRFASERLAFRMSALVLALPLGFGGAQEGAHFQRRVTSFRDTGAFRACIRDLKGCEREIEPDVATEGVKRFFA